MEKLDNKTLALIAAVVAILGGAWYLSASRQPTVYTSVSPSGQFQATGVAPTTNLPVTEAQSKATPAASTPKPQTPKVPTSSSKFAGAGPLANIKAFKESLSCAVETTGTYTKRSGIIYVTNGKVRGNFSGLINGVKTATSMIDDGTYLYAWSDGAKTGLKLIAGSSVSGSAIASRGGIDPAVTLSYACNSWTPDVTVFVPPAAVTFTDSAGN